MRIEEALLKLPKTDLHCHLDGSMRLETILDISKKERIDLGATTLAELRKRLVLGERLESLEKFLHSFDITCAVMQSPEAIERIAFELAEDAAAENVRYLEVRFAPIFCTLKGLTPKEVMLAAREGLKRAEARFPIRTGLIVCAIRVMDPSVSISLAELAVSLKGHGVVGFDLAHAEKGNPAGNHREAFRLAAKGGLGITVHAGENDGPQSIQQAVDLCGAMRIGHGLTLHQDTKLEARIRDQGICLECCPSSNVQISLIRSWKEHPFKSYVHRGVRATLNTDNRLLTGIRVTDEYIRAAQHLGLTWDELAHVAMNGFEAAFAPAEDRDKMMVDARAEIARLSRMIQ